jgi:putative membrane protein
MIKTLFNFVRGVLIGIAEVIPGVSGGTIALITGIYNRLLDNADLVFRSFLKISTPSVIVRVFAKLEWKLLIPVFTGMVIALVLGAKFIEPLLETNPIELRSIFAGLVAAGIYIPYKMSLENSQSRWGLKDYVLALIAALAAFLLTGLPPGEISNPSTVVIFFSAAVAICALVLPGISGSFILLTIGMYSTTISAVNERNFQYLIIFSLGALVGLASFVSFLKWLLKEKSRTTLVILAGLMVGSLRALWPWQTEARDLLAPNSLEIVSISLFVVGVLIVWVLLKIENKIGERE